MKNLRNDVIHTGKGERSSQDNRGLNVRAFEFANVTGLPRRRIAMVSEHASPLADPGSVDSGGQNVYVAQTALHLARLGYAVDVFTRRDEKTLPEILRWEDGVRVIHVPAGPPEFVPKEKLLPYMKDFSHFMIEFIRQETQLYDLIHAHFWMSGLVAVEVKRALGIPFVITFHALGRVRRLHQGKDDGFPDTRFIIEDQIVQEADGIIAECPQDNHDLRCLYSADPAKLAVIPCGFDPAEMWPMDKTLSRRLLGISDDEWVLLQLGRMVPRKGVDNVIRGFARLVRQGGLRARLLVVGGESAEPDPEITPEIGRLQKIADEEGVSDRVKFTGRRGREVLKHFYSAADVFISTPWYEPFGITPIEAMACGTPVIGAKVGGIQFSVSDGETGYLVPPNDPDALAERLLNLYQHPDLQEAFGKRAIQRANLHFTWKKVAEEMAGLYESLVVGETVRGQKSEADDDLAAIERGFENASRVLQRSRQALGEPIRAAGRALISALAAGSKVIVAGNGGSAADSQHFAAEFVGRFMYPDRKGLPVLALTADTAFLTAWANDVAYEQVFSRQVETFGQPGDVFIGISTSGRSRNLIEAFYVARSRGMTCIALLGGDGGDLLQLADIALLVPSANTARIQEVHILMLHMLSELVEKHFVAESLASSPSLISGVAASSQSPLDLLSSDLGTEISVRLDGQKS